MQFVNKIAGTRLGDLIIHRTCTQLCILLV